MPSAACTTVAVAGKVWSGVAVASRIDVDVFPASKPRRLERRARRRQRQVGGGLAVGGDMALADAGARDDPLVGGVDAPRQLVVGDDLFRQIGAAARQRCATLCHGAAAFRSCLVQP